MKKTFMFAAALALVVGFASPAYADHAWGSYHWARTANPFTLKVVDSVTPAWDGYLDVAIADWSLSSVLDLAKEAGSVGSTDRRKCNPIAGKIRVCNQAYGKTGWLGIASIWASGSHITKGTTKLNDTYFGTVRYDTPAWRQLVTCQEIGHDFGLAHQDEDFANQNLGTCMDYTSDPSTNQHPDQHDYDELGLIYAHLDTTTTVAASTAARAPASEGLGDDPHTWGTEVKRSADGKHSIFEKKLFDGSVVLTDVFWSADGRAHALGKDE